MPARTEQSAGTDLGCHTPHPGIAEPSSDAPAAGGPASFRQPALRRVAHGARRRTAGSLIRVRPEPRPDRFAGSPGLDRSATSSRGLLYRHLEDVDTVHYRQEIFRDLEDPACIERLRHFGGLVRQVRTTWIRSRRCDTTTKVRVAPRRGRHLLRCGAFSCGRFRPRCRFTLVLSLAFREFLSAYAASPNSPRWLPIQAIERRARANPLLRSHSRCTSRREPLRAPADYSAEVLSTFQRFKQGAVKDYRVNYRTWPGMNHVGAQILALVARLFSAEFSALDEYCRRHAGFFDETIRRFERELQFYLAYVDYINPLRATGLSFCYPEVTADSKAIFATDTFDLALAKKTGL